MILTVPSSQIARIVGLGADWSRERRTVHNGMWIGDRKEVVTRNGLEVWSVIEYFQTPWSWARMLLGWRLSSRPGFGGRCDMFGLNSLSLNMLVIQYSSLRHGC